MSATGGLGSPVPRSHGGAGKEAFPGKHTNHIDTMHHSCHHVPGCKLQINFQSAHPSMSWCHPQVLITICKQCPIRLTHARTADGTLPDMVLVAIRDGPYLTEVEFKGMTMETTGADVVAFARNLGKTAPLMLYVIPQAADPRDPTGDELAVSTAIRWAPLTNLRRLMEEHMPTRVLPTIRHPDTGGQVLLLKALSVAMHASHGGK
jgi:hypothetical protein